MTIILNRSIQLRLEHWWGKPPPYTNIRATTRGCPYVLIDYSLGRFANRPYNGDDIYIRGDYKKTGDNTDSL